MIKRLLGNNECRLQLLHQPEPIRASRVPTIPLVEAQEDSAGLVAALHGSVGERADGRELASGSSWAGACSFCESMPSRRGTRFRIDPLLQQAK